MVWTVFAFLEGMHNNMICHSQSEMTQTYFFLIKTLSRVDLALAHYTQAAEQQNLLLQLLFFLSSIIHIKTRVNHTLQKIKLYIKQHL